MPRTAEHPENTYRGQADLHRALDHPVRLAILEILRDGEECVCHMEAILGLRQAYISQHLMVLREAGLVQDRRDGRIVFYHAPRREVYKVMDAVRALTGPGQLLKPAENCPCPKCNR